MVVGEPVIQVRKLMVSELESQIPSAKHEQQASRALSQELDKPSTLF